MQTSASVLASSPAVACSSGPARAELTSRSNDTARPAPISFASPHRVLDVGHSRLASWTFGSGPDVVFVHGWPLSAATFRHVVEELRGAYTCHLVDLPGAGLTETTAASPIELRAHADTLRAAIDRLGLTRYALVGHDSGGFVARRVAASDDRVVGVVLGNTELPSHTPPLLVAYMLLARSGLGPSLLRPLLASRSIRRSPLGFGGCFEDPTYAEGAFHDLFVRPLLSSRPALDGAIALLANAGRHTLADLPEIHARIHAPVRLIWGADDPWFPLPKARAMLAQLGGPADLVAIPGAKLFVHEDHAAEFAAHTRDFLEGVTR